MPGIPDQPHLPPTVKYNEERKIKDSTGMTDDLAPVTNYPGGILQVYTTQTDADPYFYKVNIFAWKKKKINKKTSLR